MPSLTEFIRGMPKAELHLHIEGTLEVIGVDRIDHGVNILESEKLIAAQQGADLQAEDLLQLERNAFEIAWLPASIRDGYLAEIGQYAAAAGPP